MTSPEGEGVYEIGVQRGPLPEPWRTEVMEGWGRYDQRLANPAEWEQEFEAGPAGPALHVLALSPEGHVAGHHALIPLRLRLGERELVAGKGEALYVDARWRRRGARALVDGRALRLAEALTSVMYDGYRDAGFEAYFGYATPQAEERHVESGCSVLLLPYRRFFLFHDPGAALESSSAVSGWRSRAVHVALAGQSALARARLRRGRDDLAVEEVDAFDPALEEGFRAGLDPHCLALDPSGAQLGWRFPPALYRLFVLGSPPWGYVVVTRLESSRRVRVIDWLVPAPRLDAVPALARLLGRVSADLGAAALEWNVPVNSAAGDALAARLRRTPLLADRRSWSYRMVVHGREPFTQPERWLLTLASQERF